MADGAVPITMLTMCDLRFLPQMLCLHRSLGVAGGNEIQLQVLCMDAASERFLRAAGPASVIPVSLAELERHDPELAALREQRTWLEYCWTATPAFCHMALERVPPGGVALWVDADVEFFGRPEALLRQLGPGSVLLTPHRYYMPYPRQAPAWLLQEMYGTFNGGTIAFRRDQEGVAAADLWRRRSLAWCHDRVEPGRFGNQGHLDDFPQLFPGARVLAVPGGGLAPWNAGQYRLRSGDTQPSADGQPVLFYHFQSLRLHRRRGAGRPWAASNLFALPRARIPAVGRTTPWYRISRGERRLFWRPYMRRLAQSMNEVAAFEKGFRDTLPGLTSAQVADDLGHRLRLNRARIAGPVRRPPRRAGAALPRALHPKGAEPQAERFST